MKDRLRIHKKNLKLIGIVILLLALPLNLILVRTIQDTRSSAALPNQLETEAGVLSSSGVTKQTSTQASGGQYVRFTKSTTNPTPTSAPTPTIPSNAVYVPDSIDSTGSTDVQLELNNFIKNTPDGSTIVFKKNGTYQISRLIWMRGRNNITIEGNGATLKLTGNNGNGWWDSAMHIDYFSQSITVRNFIIIGNHPTVGTPDACCNREGQSGIMIGASKNVLIENTNISRVGGDCFTLSSSYQETAPNDGVTIRNNKCTLTGRMGMHTINSQNVIFEKNYFDQIGYAVFSSEPNKSFEGIRNLVIRNNTIGSYSLTGNYEGALYYYSDASWIDGPTNMSGITITGNTVEGNISGKNGLMMGLDIYIYDNGTGLREKVTVTNNTAGKAINALAKRYDSVMRFENVNGVTVTGNIQPLSSGNLATFYNCSNITYNSNNTN